MAIDEARLQRWLSSHREEAVGMNPPGAADHIDMDTLARFAVGQLSQPKARMVNEHILACDDGRCGAFVRSQASDVDAAGQLLYQQQQQQQHQQQEGEADVQQHRGGSSRGGGAQRTFQSREIVWQTFESMARELDAPIDDLVNEAMAAYAKVRGYPKVDSRQLEPPPGLDPHHDPLEETHDAPAISALDRSYSPPGRAAAPIPAAGRPMVMPPAAMAPPPPAPPMPLGGSWDDDDDLARTSARSNFQRPSKAQNLKEPGDESRTSPRFAAAFARPPAPMGGGLPPPPPASMRSMSAPPALPPRLMQPNTMPMPNAPPRAAAGISLSRESYDQQPPSSAAAGQKQLVLTYQGRTYSVEKERFLLGRSKTQADLRLDDPNVSRQHAVIEHVGSAFYIVDLGSTNGVAVHGERVARRALMDGDLITITSHEIRVSLR